jgi:hypothetical protein
MKRRSFLQGILAAGCAPAFVRYASLMVPSTYVDGASPIVLEQTLYPGGPLSYPPRIRNAMLEAVNGVLGANPVLRIYTRLPGDPSRVLIAESILEPNWMGAKGGRMEFAPQQPLHIADPAARWEICNATDGKAHIMGDLTDLKLGNVGMGLVDVKGFSVSA